MSPSKSPVGGTAARGSKSDVAYERIRASILDGTYPPGSRLVLDRVARHLDVSTLPVREAIRRLEAEGYVQFQKNVGATVASVDADSYVQAIETMAVLEGAAIGQAVGRLTGDQLKRARDLNRAMEEALERLDGRAFADLHEDLHRALIGACPNAHLVDVIEKERARLRRVRASILGLGASGGRRDITDHEELIGLLESGASSQEIEDLARAHLERSAASLRETS